MGVYVGATHQSTGSKKIKNKLNWFFFKAISKIKS